MRPEGWELRLSNYIKSVKDKPFKWGENDCILFSAKAHEAIYLEDCYSKYLPYSSEEEAQEILKKNGGFEKIIGSNLGKPHKNILKAKRGDLVLLKIPSITCGVVDDSGQHILCPSEKGIVRYPLNKAYRVWSR